MPELHKFTQSIIEHPGPNFTFLLFWNSDRPSSCAIVVCCCCCLLLFVVVCCCLLLKMNKKKKMKITKNLLSFRRNPKFINYRNPVISSFLHLIIFVGFLFGLVLVSIKTKTKQTKTKQQTKQKSTTPMSLSKQMEQACMEGKHEVVKKILSSQPESINFSYQVGNFFVFYHSSS